MCPCYITAFIYKLILEKNFIYVYFLFFIFIFYFIYFLNAQHIEKLIRNFIIMIIRHTKFWPWGLSSSTIAYYNYLTKALWAKLS